MSIRELILNLGVVATCLGALVNPIFGLLGYIWYSLARPDILSWSEGEGRHQVVMGICTLVGSWRYIPNLRVWAKNPWVISVLLLQAVILASILNAPFPTLAWGHYTMFIKYLAIAMLIPLFIVAEKEYRWLMIAVATATGLIGSKFGVWAVKGGGIVIGDGLGGFFSDNNCLAMHLNMSIPFIYYSRGLFEKYWQRALVWVVMFSTMAAVVMCHSRGGILTLALVLGMIVFRSRHKMVMLVVLAVLSLPAVLLVSDTLFKRMRTLENVEADNSASFRLEYNLTALKVFKDYPVLGLGFGTENWGLVSEKYMSKADTRHVVHNNYLQMAVDSGIFALAILCWQVFYGIWWAGRAAKKLKNLYPEKVCYPLALEGAMVAFALNSAVTSRTDYDYYYFLLMMFAAWYTIQEKLLSAPAAEFTPAVIGPARELAGAEPPLAAAPPAMPGRVIGPAPKAAPEPAAARLRTPNSPLRTSARLRSNP